MRPGGGGGNDVRPRQGSLWENGGDSVTVGGGRGGGGGGGFSDAFGLFGDDDTDGDDTDESVYVSLTDVWVPTCLHYWIRASLVLDQPAEQTGGKHVSFVLFTRSLSSLPFIRSWKPNVHMRNKQLTHIDARGVCAIINPLKRSTSTDVLTCQCEVTHTRSHRQPTDLCCHSHAVTSTAYGLARLLL